MTAGAALRPKFTERAPKREAGLNLWRGHQPDERESMRVRLVALACEVAVVAARIDEDLAAAGRRVRARELKDVCWEHRRIALELLSPTTSFEELSDAGLRNALDAFRERAHEVARLRRRADRILQGEDSDLFWSSTFQ